ncbi:MAG: GWxTD domain-containing protein [bacterium]
MRKIANIIIFFVCFLALVAFQETKNYDFKKVFGLPPFIFRSLQFPTIDSEKARLQINLGLVNDILQFVKHDDGTYSAGYEISLDLLDSNDTIITGIVTQHHISVDEFEESNSRQYFNTHSFEFEASAGKHALHLDIIDLETRKRLTRREEIEVREFASNKLEISSIAFLSNHSSPGKVNFNLTEIYSQAKEDIKIKFVLSALKTGQLLEIDYALKDWHDRIITSWRESLTPQQAHLEITRSIREQIDNAGNYVLSIKCTQNDTSVEENGTFSVKFQPQMSNGKENLTLPNKSYFALKYICKNDYYEQIIEADNSAQEELVRHFWQERDPTPGTNENELRDEFHRRASFANTHFSVLALKRQGWETDRGKIYILNGPPTWVRTQSNDFGRPPIEIWYYKELDVRFVFRDRKGDGHYKLIHEE